MSVRKDFQEKFYYIGSAVPLMCIALVARLLYAAQTFYGSTPSISIVRDGLAEIMMLCTFN